MKINGKNRAVTRVGVFEISGTHDRTEGMTEYKWSKDGADGGLDQGNLGGGRKRPPLSDYGATGRGHYYAAAAVQLEPTHVGCYRLRSLALAELPLSCHRSVGVGLTVYTGTGEGRRVKVN